MGDQNWEEGWLDEVLSQADQVVQSWPSCMREPEMRYPLNRHRETQGAAPKITREGNITARLVSGQKK
jgi:hypothetical protein